MFMTYFPPPRLKSWTSSVALKEDLAPLLYHPDLSPDPSPDLSFFTRP